MTFRQGEWNWLHYLKNEMATPTYVKSASFSVLGFEGLSHQNGATPTLQKKTRETFLVVYMSLQSDVSANRTELSD